MSTATSFRHPLHLVGLAAVALLTLTGCSTAGDFVNQVSTKHFSTTTELRADWDTDADFAWVPADATDITARWSDRDDTATLLLLSDESLNSTQCAQIDRESVPTLEIEGAPDAYSVDRVYACGDWTVAATDNGWLGWTPNDPDEKAQSPAE